jgi:hypothetical protein
MKSKTKKAVSQFVPQFVTFNALPYQSNNSFVKPSHNLHTHIHTDECSSFYIQTKGTEAESEVTYRNKVSDTNNFLQVLHPSGPDS